MYKSNVISLDLKSLKDVISVYKEECHCDPNFIIMNEDTERELRRNFEEEFETILYEECVDYHRKGSIKFSAFWKIPISICNKLNFGDFEVV